jgi:nucleotide-binding universal stress UspA family protein
MLKDIVVFVDPAPPSEARLRLAASLARAHGAHLTGVHVIAVPEVAPALRTGMLDRVMRLHLHGAQDAAAACEATFRALLAREGLRGDWRVSRGEGGTQAALHARYADLAVIGQVDPGWQSLIAPLLPDEVALAAGRPVLVTPCAGHGDTVGERVLIAWNAGREAARAVNDALPLLRTARAVTVLVANPAASAGGHRPEAGADIALHLSRHGIHAEIERHDVADDAVPDLLLSRAAALAADLVVMGAYGRPRVRELVLGGVTREMLRRMTVPVLMSH